MFCRFIHVSIICTSVFLWLTNIPLYVCTTFVYLFIVGCLGYLHLLAIVNSAAVNMCVLVLVFSSLGIYLGVELLNHMVILCLTF